METNGTEQSMIKKKKKKKKKERKKETKKFSFCLIKKF